MAIKKKEVSAMVLLPPMQGVCPTCATEHEAELPHNWRSLYYQYSFYQAKGRWPTKEDAFAHVSPELRAEWQKAEAEMKKELGPDGT